MNKEMTSTIFREDLEYDYLKYTTKLDELETEINDLSSKKIVAVSSGVVSSATWHNEHNQESYDDAQQRLERERIKRVTKNKSVELQSWIDHGLFQRKLTFENGSNFYITTASVEVNYSFGNGDFLISYWGTDAKRVQTLMKFDIGDESPKNGELLVVGDFTPKKKDLTNIRYKNKKGKQEYKSAKRTIENLEEEKPVEKPLIDTDKFFRLKFNLAGIGDQSKALYDTNSAIIDGAAGTGKSTIALQKLKYLHINENVSQKDMFVIVKNKEAIPHFKTLLQDDELKLNDVEIQTVSSLFEILDINVSINKEDIDKAFSTSVKLKNSITNDIKNINRNNLEKHFNHLFKNIGIHRFIDSLNEMLNEINNDLVKKQEIIHIDEELKQINEDLINDDIEDEAKLELLDELKRLNNRKSQLSGENYKRALKIFEATPEKVSIDIFKQISEHNYNARDAEELNVIHWMKRYINYYIEQERTQKQLKDTIDQIKILKILDEYNADLSAIKDDIAIVNLQLNEDPESDTLKEELKALVSKEKKILSDIKKHETLPAKKTTLETRLTKIFNVNIRDRKIYEKVLTNIYMTDQHLTTTYLKDYSPTEAYLLRQYLLKMDKPFNTFIIDEAQDYSIVELELLRLQAKRIVLTGDILQNIQVNDIENWEDIFNVYEVFGVENKAGDSELNIFNLKHNFRQTYQLANASFNFRQLLLESGLEDIEKEYYLSEKEFNGIPYNVPLLKYISFDNEIKQYFDEKIEHIKNTYSSKIPIALICKDSTEKAKYESFLKHLKLSSNTKVLKNVDVILVDILEAKGKEFPIVVCNIDDMTDNELYLIMTRAQFELDFITSRNECTNNKIGQLVERTWIKIDGIDGFIDLQEEILDETEEDEVPVVAEGEGEGSSDASGSKTTVEKIIDHKGDVTQTVDELEPAVILDEQKYKDTFLEQLSKQQIGTQKREVIFIRKEIDRDKTKIHNEIKYFLYKTYKGYCQSCGFTFRKINDKQNSFEKFSWSDKRIVKVVKRIIKVDKSFISSAESLCLCRNCVANIKFGSFDPVFIQKILDIESFETQSFDEIISLLHNVVDINPPEIFEDHTEFDDMFALEIKLNQKERNLYFTKDHLMQFIVFLQLEKKIEIKNELRSKLLGRV